MKVGSMSGIRDKASHVHANQQIYHSSFTPSRPATMDASGVVDRQARCGLV